MSTKQLRLNDRTEIKSRIKEFSGKRITIILIDNTAMFGELAGVGEKGILLKNMRLKKIHYPFDQITEVYLDTIV